MKKLLLSLLALMTLGCSLTACSSDDNEDPVYNHTQTPEQAAQGTYSGQFIRLQANSSTAVPEYGEGTLVIIPSDTAYVAHVRFECAELAISAETPVNITYANDGFMFSNDLSTNPLGSPISGHINAVGTAESGFQLKIRQGRSTKTFDISFSGTR